MVYTKEEIMRDVRICLDQNKASETLLQEGDIDTLSVDEIIGSKILEAVERVHSAAPVYLLEEGHSFGDAVYWEDLESGRVLLPQDFMRLIVFEMSDWERPVYEAIGTTDAEYWLQRQRIKALRGTPQRPVCAIGIRPEGKVLEFYSCKSEEAYVRRAQYMPYPKIDADGGVDISERCYTAVIYTIAGLVLMTYGEADKAAAIAELAKTKIQ